MTTAEKMIPKATLLRALHEILDAARTPHALAYGQTGAIGADAHAFALGWIEGVARAALGADAPTIGWLAAKAEERQS